jgi:hypothetical protein
MPTNQYRKPTRPGLSVDARKLLLKLHGAASKRSDPSPLATVSCPPAAEAELLSADLVERRPRGELMVTAAGAAFLARETAAPMAEHVDPYIAQHLVIASRDIAAPEGARPVVVDDSESPLGWLARRKGRDGQPLLAAHQLAAGERLRAEFTKAHLMPRVTANWQAAVSRGSRRAHDGGHVTEAIVATRQRVRHALEAAGPEFSGLLIDVCCFLKRLEDVERERVWPARSAKVVLQLGLDRLARHYGLHEIARGRAQGRVRAWAAPELPGIAKT